MNFFQDVTKIFQSENSPLIVSYKIQQQKREHLRSFAGMKAFTFKTTLKCSGCEATVKPYLDAVEGIQSWNVDLSNPDKLLTTTGCNTPEAVIEALKNAGFKAELRDRD